MTGRFRKGRRRSYGKPRPQPADAEPTHAITHAIGFVLTDGVVTTLRIRA